MRNNIKENQYTKDDLEKNPHLARNSYLSLYRKRVLGGRID